MPNIFHIKFLAKISNLFEIATTKVFFLNIGLIKFWTCIG